MSFEESIVRDAYFYGMLRESHSDPSASGRVVVESRRALVLDTFCRLEEHRGWEWWSRSGSLVCGLCDPPVEAEPRWLATGGPVYDLPDLTAVGSVVVIGRDYDPPELELENDEEAHTEPAVSRGRHEPLDGQVSLLGG